MKSCTEIRIGLHAMQSTMKKLSEDMAPYTEYLDASVLNGIQMYTKEDYDFSDLSMSFYTQVAMFNDFCSWLISTFRQMEKAHKKSDVKFAHLLEAYAEVFRSLQETVTAPAIRFLVRELIDIA